MAITRYPRPNIITYDKGTEFLAEFAKMIKIMIIVEYANTNHNEKSAIKCSSRKNT
jgi:hypothetical protein